MLLFNYGDEISLNPRQLLFDTLVSGLFLIMAFSLLYWAGGLSVSEGKTYSPSALDALYFSAVTFSTLGYGDFAPSQDFRILAALEAIIGNLHLGMIAGSVLAAIRR